ncbi:MAG: SHOCT domain-containing protein [Halofilum sp. (in: g-proteobacteria)]
MKIAAPMTRGLALASGLTATAPALAQSGAGGWNHPGMMGGAGWIMGPLMMFLWVAVTVGIVALVFRWLGGPGDSGAQRPISSACKILEERFARGEIDEEEFRKRKQALEE